MTSTFLHLSARGERNVIFYRLLLCLLLSASLGVAAHAQHVISGNIFLDHNGDGIRNGLDFGHPIIRANV